MPLFPEGCVPSTRFLVASPLNFALIPCCLDHGCQVTLVCTSEGGIYPPLDTILHNTVHAPPLLDNIC